MNIKSFSKVLGSGILAVLLSSSASVEARDLTYKFGVGYKQVFTNGFVAENGAVGGAEQLNGIHVSYGIARDFHVDVNFATRKNFDAFVLGPSVRYEIHRLVSQSLAAWNHLNIFVQSGFMVKAGDKVKTGLVLQLPYIGFDILPFEANDFAITASAGFAFDLLEENMIGFTNGMFGDVGLKYYF